MGKAWVHGHGWDCPACGSEVEIFTDAHEERGHQGFDVVFFCDDKARCPAHDCDWKGCMYACEDDWGVNEGNLMDLDENNRVVAP